jgi:hypothetical protein
VSRKAGGRISRQVEAERQTKRDEETVEWRIMRSKGKERKGKRSDRQNVGREAGRWDSRQSAKQAGRWAVSLPATTSLANKYTTLPTDFFSFLFVWRGTCSGDFSFNYSIYDSFFTLYPSHVSPVR